MLIGAPDGIIMFAFISAMIHIVPATTTNTMRHAKGEREYVVGAFRPAGDVQEKHQVNAHLGNGEDSEAEEYAAWPEQRRVCGPERRGREKNRHK